MGGALEGIRILDLSQWQQGPYATVMLSDLGADVIKVERPQYGDAGRHALGGYDPQGLAPDFFAHNRGKRGMTIDLRNPRGRDLVLELSERMDVMVTNFRLGVMERWGLGYDDVKARNPRIIYAQASGTGPRGPERERPMFDIVAQAMGGIMSVTGGEGEPPTPVGTFMADQMGAIMLTVSILSALVARERTGAGQAIDVSLLGTQVALQSFEIQHYLMTGDLPRRAGRGHPHGGLLWNTFPAADGYFAMAGVREDRWPEFCALIEQPDLIEDPRFDCAEHREEHRGVLLDRLDAVFRQQSIAHWMALLATIDLACGPVQTYEGVAQDPQVLANDYITEMDHPTLGPTRVVNTPIALSETPVEVKGPPPELGQHTEEVLLELGYDWPQIIELRDAGAI
ncbi:MAG: CoA transferase [Dehalococcoidia bacterium]|nr:CoA transferase [Dehalococcoidia bacterium]